MRLLETSADLTWAELYSKKIQSDLKVVSPAIRKSPTTPETAQSAALLRQQLQVAHRLLDELRKRTRV
jgi:hypothetical protein